VKTAVGILVILFGFASVSPAVAQIGLGGGTGAGAYGGSVADSTATQGTEPSVLRDRERAPKGGSDPESYAEGLRKAGRCDQALATLRDLADKGAGYEISQFNLGLCLLDLAPKDPPHAAEMRQEAATWILGAANANYSNAQQKAVLLYLDGTGVPVDPAEAEKWALLYGDNGMRLTLGLPDIAPDVRARLDKALVGDLRVQGHRRANAWTPVSSNLDQ
jgi:hypothetical protein